MPKKRKKVRKVKKKDNFLKYFWQLTLEYWEEAIIELTTALFSGVLIAEIVAELAGLSMSMSMAGTIGILLFVFDLLYWSIRQEGMFFRLFEKLEGVL